MLDPIARLRKTNPTGLVNFFSGIQTEGFGTSDLNSIYGGKIIEHLVGQKLLASHDSMLFSPHFWVREKSQPNAEVDSVLPHKTHVIPIEVKSGATGRLRSLHSFMDQVEHGWALRLYAGSLKCGNGENVNREKLSAA